MNALSVRAHMLAAGADARPHDRIADEVLDGARAISEETGYPEKRVYALAARGELPCFKVGGRLTSTRSLLRQWLADKVAA